MTRLLLVAVLTANVVLGCAMLSAWRSIPPPGGCDQCHKAKISANWVASFEPVTLPDETGEYPWDRAEVAKGNAPNGDLGQQELTEQFCFRCHKSPDLAHRQMKGRYHHAQ